MIHVVRHADAGDRSTWEGPDTERPLTPKGRRQAEAIADALIDSGIDTVWSSRYVRCRQTVEPLASRLGLEVIDHDHLAEGSWGTDALDALLAEADAGRTVLACSHGDVIPELLRAAVRRGATLHGPEMPRKADRYELQVENGEVTKIHHFQRTNG
ncbi:MAG: histidine phosphatase family protein [Acidimicrobiales bacterium]|nr:histidine phosphatase family protein [Acidimicrobiales bacterium]